MEIPQSGSALECQKFIPFAENISERLIRENSIKQAVLRSDIAYLLGYIAEYQKAEKLYKKALGISERVLGEKHPDTAASYNNLAGAYKSQGKYKIFLSYYLKSYNLKSRPNYTLV